DDLGFAPSIRKVLVPGAGTGAIALIDPDNFAVATIGGFSIKAYAGGHDDGVTSADEGAGVLLATDRTTRSLLVIDPVAKTIVARAKLAGGPDYVRWVGARSEVWVTEPDVASIEVFAMNKGQPSHAAKVEVPGGPESLVIDAKRGRAYANLWSDKSVAVDLAKRAVVATWSNGCQGSRGIALDAERGLLFVGCKEGKVVALDVEHDGKIVGSAATGAGVDIIAYAPQLGHVYAPGGRSATTTIVGVGPGGALSVVGTLPGAEGGHCVTADDRGHVYV